MKLHHVSVSSFGVGGVFCGLEAHSKPITRKGVLFTAEPPAGKYVTIDVTEAEAKEFEITGSCPDQGKFVVPVEIANARILDRN